MPGAAPVSPLRFRDFRLTLFASAAAFFGYSLLLPVVPMWAVSQGAGPFAAGAATGGFMAATVLAQFAMPSALRRFGYRPVLLAGALFLALPTPLLIVAQGETAAGVILGISVLRGVGFGVLTVCGSALIAELLPRRLVAKGSGLYGLAAGFPQLFGLPSGTWLAEHWGFAPVFLLATALPLCAVLPFLLLPVLRPRQEPKNKSSVAVVVKATWKPWLPMLAVSTGFGGLATFLPIVVASPSSTIALFVAPAAAVLSRWAAGHFGDRMAGPGRMLPAGLAASGLGLLGFALLSSNGPVVVLAVALFGLGFGVVQNDALVAMFARAPAGAASVSWNVAFDLGQGLGAVAVGAIVTGFSFPLAFGLLAVVAVGLLPVAWLARHGSAEAG
ncbi:arabinose ABC transporter permease [Prauserella marina]|nr:arabinose ABC transporter permease [Prauserella marina]